MPGQWPKGNRKPWNFWALRSKPGDLENQQTYDLGSPGLGPPLSSSKPVLRITVGSGVTQRIFQVEEEKVRNCSRGWGSGEVIILGDEDPAVFALFAQWLQSEETPVSYGPGRTSSSEPWISNAARAWVLGERLKAPRFQRYALSQLITTCALAAFGPWKYIEEKTSKDSAIRRFSDHWVAWNSYLAGPKSNEYSGLAAAKRRPPATKDTRDPRTFDIEHWYMDCGKKLDPKCRHDPITRQKELEAARNRKIPQKDYGSSFEALRQGKLNGSNSGSQNTLPGPSPYNPPRQTPRPVSRSSRGCCTITLRMIAVLVYVGLIGLLLWRSVLVHYFHKYIPIKHSIQVFSLATAAVGGLSVLFYPLVIFYILFAVPDAIVMAFYTSRAAVLSQEALGITILLFVSLPFSWAYIYIMDDVLDWM